MNEGVLEALRRLGEDPRVRLHTPGHHGRGPREGWFLHWRYDLTEVDGLGPETVRVAESRAAALYHTRRTWFSTQGATLPVMAGILGAIGAGAEVWVERACHRSVMSALALGGYRVHWGAAALGPGGVPVPTRDIKRPLDLPAIVTRPTYDGLARPDLAAASAVTVVDEAHGAHWIGAGGFPQSALTLGADVVAHGVHKTLPALTQTGLLHVVGSRVDLARIQQWWDMLATSSPSYLLLAAIEAALVERGAADERWTRLAEGARRLWQSLEDRGIGVLQAWWERQGGQADPAKLTLLGSGLATALRERGWEPEKATADSVTLVLPPDPDWDSLSHRLGELPATPSRIWDQGGPWPQPVAAMPMAEALQRAGRWVPLVAACGRVARDWVVPYPPGIPLIAPGERFDDAVVGRIFSMRDGRTMGMEGDAVWVVA